MLNLDSRISTYVILLEDASVCPRLGLRTGTFDNSKSAKISPVQGKPSTQQTDAKVQLIYLREFIEVYQSYRNGLTIISDGFRKEAYSNRQEA